MDWDGTESLLMCSGVWFGFQNFGAKRRDSYLDSTIAPFSLLIQAQSTFERAIRPGF